MQHLYGSGGGSDGSCQCVFADPTFETEVQRYARAILANSWFSLRENKRLLLETEGMTLKAGLAHEVLHTAGTGPDMQARIASFAQRKR